MAHVHKRRSAQKRREKVWRVGGLQDHGHRSVARVGHEDARGQSTEWAEGGKGCSGAALTIAMQRSPVN